MNFLDLMQPIFLHSFFGIFLLLIVRVQNLKTRITTVFLALLGILLFIDFSWLSITYFSILLFVMFLEWKHPRVILDRSPREVANLGAYILVKRVGGPLALLVLLSLNLETWLAPWGMNSQGFPVWAQSLMALLVLDAKQYWLHRGQHRFDFWWRFHRVHHLTPKVSAIAHGRTHLFEFVFVQVLSNFCVAKLLGLHPVAVLYGYLFPGLVVAAIWAHANINFPRKKMPFWGYIFSSPNVHGFHHLNMGDHKNLGEILIIWDILFGTFIDPTKQSLNWDNFGVAGTPCPESFWKEQLLQVGTPNLRESTLTNS